jgi:hypothetical protein
LALPRNDDFIDTQARLLDSINLLASVYEVLPIQIIRAIENAGSDIILIRILTDNSNAFPLNEAGHILLGFEGLIAATAQALTNPNRKYFSRTTKIAKKEAAAWKIGHTVRGSFGFTIETPLFQPPLPGMESFSQSVHRRVSERIIRGLKLAHEATVLQDREMLINSFSQGLNANMCEAIMSTMRELGKYIELEYSVVWSPFSRPPEDLTSIKPILFEQSTYSYIEQASKALKKGITEAPLITIRGHILELKVDKDREQSEQSRREIIILPDDSTNQIHVLLTPAEYYLACNAHRDNKLVELSGKLVRHSTRLSLLEDYYDFKVLETMEEVQIPLET